MRVERKYAAKVARKAEKFISKYKIKCLNCGEALNPEVYDATPNEDFAWLYTACDNCSHVYSVERFMLTTKEEEWERMK